MNEGYQWLDTTSMLRSPSVIGMYLSFVHTFLVLNLFHGSVKTKFCRRYGFSDVQKCSSNVEFRIVVIVVYDILCRYAKGFCKSGQSFTRR